MEYLIHMGRGGNQKVNLIQERVQKVFSTRLTIPKLLLLYLLSLKLDKTGEFLGQFQEYYIKVLLKPVPRQERARPVEKQQEREKWVHHLLSAKEAHNGLQLSLQHPRNNKVSKFNFN